MTRKRILLIDDDADDRETFCEALQEAAPEFICDTARSGRKALTALENNEFERPDLIFIDINMPVVDGWQILTFLKGQEQYKDIPVVMYSTSSYPEDVVKANQLGALCFFTKPYDFVELIRSLGLIADYLDKKLPVSLILSSPLFLTASV